MSVGEHTRTLQYRIQRGKYMTMATPDMALVPTSNRGLELGFTGNLGNIDAYISAVNRLPMLTHDEEMSLARRLQQNNCAWSCRSHVAISATGCRTPI
jgi:DNA-directed RNA polymerase sigma subunit (sigma70/sigma32)